MKTDSVELAKIFREIETRGEVYDDDVLTPAFEARNVNAPGIHAAKKGDMSRFTINGDFPMRLPALVEENSNASRWFVRIEPESGEPVVARQERNLVDNQDYWNWYFPIGTKFVEVSRVHDESGKAWVFQFPVLELTDTAWMPKVFRSDLLVDASLLRSKFGDHVLSDIVEISRIDVSHPLRPMFNQTAMMVNLPALPASSLADSTFVEVVSAFADFNGQEVAGPTSDSFSLVPKEFAGCMIAANPVSCARCHEATGQHVNLFDRFGNQQRRDSGVVGRRHWYGLWRGNAPKPPIATGIVSWHPFAEESISTNGANLPVKLRAGVEVFDPKRHDVRKYPGLKA